MPKFKDFVESTYTVPMVKRKLPPLVTSIEPEKRTFKNLPRYADGKPKVRFQDWLLIKPQKRSPEHSVASFGKSDADGKWYGWSHRAVYGFKKGDVIKPGDSGNDTEKEFTLTSDDNAREYAIKFAESVS